MIAQRKPNNDKGFKDFHPDFAGFPGRRPHFRRVLTKLVKRAVTPLRNDVGFCQRPGRVGLRPPQPAFFE
ncbi:hypothetical protein [Burkholderia glumae]|uniref:hypothetical protein n=1 Tax=Burkholderia glumae TaxID=337 RepID=UPI0012FAB616|nr:hypothetical protein [Burkholderia glumae]MCM2491615.1 hypothetical protein [Burkholderia glumae]MCM2542605.1 hypothetical protein [Burkholderia glumae]